MTAVLPVGPTTVSGPQWRPRRAWPVVLVVIAVAAFSVRFALLTRGGGLVGDAGYDDGVYYAAADALLHGRFPYRDFLLLHPPGIVLALLGPAAIGTVLGDPIGFALARLLFVGIGALNAVLCAAIARRFGAVAAVVAGGTYAVFAPAVYGERSTLLEPLGTCLLLCGALVAQRAVRRPAAGAVLAGALAGAAAGVKIWYLVPAVILAAFQPGRRRLASGGVVAGLVLICGPFFAAAPVAMTREVVLDQLGRPRSLRWPPVRRLIDIVGASHEHSTVLTSLLTPHKIGAVLLLAVLALGAVSWTVRGARIWPLLTGATVVVLLGAPSYFTHYAAFAAPALAITAGIGIDRLTRLRGERGLRAVAAVAAITVVALTSARDDGATRTRPIPAAALAPAAEAVAGCVQSDSPGLLVSLDVLSRDLAARCPFQADLTGAAYDLDRESRDGWPVPRAGDATWQRHATDLLTSGSAVILHRAGSGLSASSRDRIVSGPILASSGGFVLHRIEH